MKTIKRNGENFAKEIQNVGETICFEASGCKCVVLKYYKSQPKTEAEKKARPLGGNKTQVTVKWENGKEESYNTDELRAKYCPDYATSQRKQNKLTRENLSERIEVLEYDIKELQTRLKNLKEFRTEVENVEKVLGMKMIGLVFEAFAKEKLN